MPDSDVGGKDSWINQLVAQNGIFSSHTHWRLARAVLTEGLLLIYTCSRLPYKYFDPAIEPQHPLKESSLESGISKIRIEAEPAAADPSFFHGSGLPVCENMAEDNLRADGDRCETGPLKRVEIKHRSSEQHPELGVDRNNGSVVRGSAEALCHYLLFADAPPAQLSTVARVLPFCSSIVDAAAIMKGYLNLAVAGELGGVSLRSLAQRVDSDVRLLCKQYPALIINAHVHTAFVCLVASLQELDDAVAFKLKDFVEESHRAAEDLISLQIISKSANISSNQSVHKLHELEELKKHKDAWLPLDLMFDENFLEEFAEQISIFHCAAWNVWSPMKDHSLLFHRSVDKYIDWHKNPLVFDQAHPHFLAKLALNHFLAPNLKPSVRGSLFKSWIELGRKLHDRGDTVGWIAIAAALCQPPILRLSESWAYVPYNLRTLVSQEWGFEIFEIEKRSRIDLLDKRTFRTSAEELGQLYPKSRCVPYFIDAIVTEDRGADDYLCVYRQLNRISAAIEGWQVYFNNAQDITGPYPEPVPFLDYQELLINWHHRSHSSHFSFEACESASLDIQPRALGNYLPYFYTQQNTLATGDFVPLLFTDVIPSFRLWPQADLILASSLSAEPSKQEHRREKLLSDAISESNEVSCSSVPKRKAGLIRSNSFPPLFSQLATGNLQIETDTRKQILNSTSDNALVKSIRDLLNVGVATYDTGLDLIFKSFDNDSSSRSRHSSVIESLGPKSMKTDSHRESMQSVEIAYLSEAQLGPFTPVVVKAATLPRLVDVLLLGANEVPSPSHWRLQLDMSTHMATFFATYRNFCSASELLKMISVRIFGATGLATHLNAKGTDLKWYSTGVDPSGSVLYLVTQIYTNALESLFYWVSKYFDDFASEKALRQEMMDLLLNFQQEVNKTIYPDYLRESFTRLHSLFVKQNYRIGAVARPLPMRAPARHIVHLLPPPQDTSIEAVTRYVNDLDDIAAAFLNQITLSDWMQLFEVLEIQAASKTGLFNYRQSIVTSPEDLVIQDVYSYLFTLFRSAPDDLVLNRLSPWLRELMNLHNAIADYICYQIADPMLYMMKRDRCARMNFVSKMLGVLRTRMRAFDIFPEQPFDAHSRVPSFLESAIVAGILRPESRAYASAWLQVGQELAQEFPAPGGVVNELRQDMETPNSRVLYAPYIPAESLPTTAGGLQPMTPCPGWITERFCEIVCFVPNMSVEQSNLINFDKRRYAYNFIMNILSEVTLYDCNDQRFNKLMDQYDYFVFPDPQLYKLDLRAVRDAAFREAQNLPKALQKQKVFTDHVAAELDKIRLEQRQFESLVDEETLVLSSQSMTNLAASDAKRHMRSPRPLSIIVSQPNPLSGNASIGPLADHSREKERAKSRSRLGGLLKAVRPFSVAFSGPPPNLPLASSTSLQSTATGLSGFKSTHSAPKTPTGATANSLPTQLTLNAANSSSLSQVVSPDQLSPLGDFTWKQSSVYDLADYDVVGPMPTCMFKIISGNKEHVFQAVSENECSAWVRALDEGKRLAHCRAHLKPGATQVFGVPLEAVCARERTVIPHIIDTLLRLVEERGLDEVGLYRMSGSVATVNSLKLAFDKGITLSEDDDRWLDINAVASCIKLYLRELPEPLITNALFEEFVACATSSDNLKHDLKRTINKLPRVNYALLGRLMHHLYLVVQHESANKMTTSNLAIVFSMNFLPPNAMDQMKAMQSITSAMISHVNELFEEKSKSRIGDSAQLTPPKPRSPVVSSSIGSSDSSTSPTRGRAPKKYGKKLGPSSWKRSKQRNKGTSSQ